MSTNDLDQRSNAYGPDGDDSIAPGRGTLTSRLVPPSRQTIVFRVENAEAANALADRFVQRDANGVSAGADVAIDHAASSSGSPLPGGVKDQFEASTGADLSGVGVHTGAESAQAASAVGAQAYTTGQDIHFGAGKFAPSDPFGLHLLAHEVAHTVQQQGGTARRQNKLEVSSPGDAMEVEADRAADAMVRGATTEIGSATGTARQIARKTGDDAWWKMVLIQYQAFLKQAGGDQPKALGLLKAQLGGAYPGDDAVLAKAGGGAAKPADAPADPNAPVGPTVDPPAADGGGTCDPNKPDPAPAPGGGTCDADHPDAEAPANENKSEGGEAKKEGEGGEAKKEGEGGEGKKDETPAGVPGIEVTPLKIGGYEVGLKVGAEGIEIPVSANLEIEVPPIYICPGVFGSVEPKFTLKGAVKWSKEEGWSGNVSVGGELAILINAGLPWARIYAGPKFTVELSPHVAKSGLGEVSGDLQSAIVVGAELKVPFSHGANMKTPGEWKSAGGLKFESEFAKQKLVHISIDAGGVHLTWVGPPIGSNVDALKAAREEYDRNVAGGGAEGGPASSPYDGAGGGDDGQKPSGNDGAGGSHG